MTYLAFLSLGVIGGALLFGGGPSNAVDSQWGRGVILGFAIGLIACVGKGLGL